MLPNFLPVGEIRKLAASVLPDINIITDLDFKSDESDILIVTAFTKVDKALLDKFPRLKFIQVASTGYDNVDVTEVKSRNILMCNSPSSNKESVAEHVIGMALYFLKDFGHLDREIRNGNWPILTFSRDLMGKVFGIIGMGAIGRKLAERLIQFGVGIIYYDVKRLPEEVEDELGITYVTLDELISSADIISIHVPLTETTKGMIGRKEFEKMKDGCIFINTSRAEVVVTKDLVWALKQGKIKAGIDVYDREPPDFSSELFQMDNALFSPHIAGVTVESQRRFIEETVANVIRYMQGVDPLNRVL
ncbi:D-3-phosphoglycerate dehydrogenase [Thermoplasma volcanium GSS1]|uniref:D-3-phosphoglycerate dehydrogenase n=1 Tax=Thermoplasma volcanium (strain ATCC 51530 / DSM 4299 / JCM 9571 / NBRC 15438 / GSS1) TaxID=273116 RepID=Q979D9_THEVO|nr:D-3-phosphoglycerate dehydrogenase [Thermoplasma volcanium GSS1]